MSPPNSSLGPSPAVSRAVWALVLVLPLLALAAQVIDCWFLCDDAFISFRYARNLLEGHGLCFNRGERVEGYTNFAWTLMIAGLWQLGIRPEHGAHALSLTATVATLLLVARLARQLAEPAERRCAVGIAVALTAVCPSFAVWSTSGLETRMFTALVLAACSLLLAPATNRWSVWLSGFTFGLLALTRPEGVLLFGCAAAWRWCAERSSGGRAGAVALRLGLPFALCVGPHLLWRRWYYGDWLPNTYYAKHVRPWYESGLDYLTAATLELGAWIWLPLAALAAIWRAARGDVRLLLPFAVVAPHAAYLLRIGGDHFEWRPLDFHLPLLAPLAALGLLLLLRAARLLLRRIQPPALDPSLPAVVVATLLLLVYAHGLGLSSRLASRGLNTRSETLGMRQRLDDETVPWLRWLPAGRHLASMLDHVRMRLARGVASPAQEHIVFGRLQLAGYGRCAELPRNTLPPDAVAAYSCVGIVPFHLPDLTVIDTLGLTDATVARNPVATANAQRVMAHDRTPPPGYLKARGINLELLPCAGDEAAALAVAEFALAIAPDCWLPLVSHRRTWLQSAFPADRLRAHWWLDPVAAAKNRLRVDGQAWVGRSILATFEGDNAGWVVAGNARIGPDHEPWQRVLGESALSTRGAAGSESGSAQGPVFRAEDGDTLLLFVAGEAAGGLSLQLLADGQPVRSLLPNTLWPVLTPCVWPLADVAQRSLALALRDDGPGSLTIDHVLLVRRDAAATASTGAASTGSPAAAAAQAALAAVDDLVQIAPLASVAGKAASGATTLRVTNPLPHGIRMEVELAQGTAGSALRCGPWTDGAPSAEPWPCMAAGQTATAELHLHLPHPEPVATANFIVRVRVYRRADGSPDPLADLRLRLSWRE